MTNARMRALIALPLAFALQAQRAPEDCRQWENSGRQIEPILLLATQGGNYTNIQNGAVVAEEMMQVATEGWMLPDELRIPGEDIVYPAGTPVGPESPSREARCLPRAPLAGAGDGQHRASGFGRLACLADTDGDGRFDQVKLYDTNYAMHVPQARLARTAPLPAPVALAADPLGSIWSRRRIARRLSIGTVEGGTARFILRHHHGDRLNPPQGGRWEMRADGALVYRLPAAIPVPLTWRGESASANNLVGELVRLEEGRIVEIGGLSLVIDRASPSFPGMWTVRTTASRFPRWLHIGCDGRSVRTGTDAELSPPAGRR